MAKKIRYRNILSGIALFITTCIYSQVCMNESLNWIPHDSISETILIDTSEIISWSYSLTDIPDANYETTNIKIGDYNLFIVIIDVCSGIYCPVISIFRKENGYWHLITGSYGYFSEKLRVEVNTHTQMIVFLISSRRVGELAFDEVLK